MCVCPEIALAVPQLRHQRVDKMCQRAAASDVAISVANEWGLNSARVIVQLQAHWQYYPLVYYHTEGVGSQGLNPAPAAKRLDHLMRIAGSS